MAENYETARRHAGGLPEMMKLKSCTHPDHVTSGNKYVTVERPASRNCGILLDYKTDGNGENSEVECNRLRAHRGAHRGKYGEETIRWK